MKAATKHKIAKLVDIMLAMFIAIPMCVLAIPFCLYNKIKGKS